MLREWMGRGGVRTKVLDMMGMLFGKDEGVG